MNAWQNAFERKWLLIFLVLYVLIMIPFPFFYNTEYVPSFFGTPVFIFAWLAYGAMVILFVWLWGRACMARPEYHEFDDEETTK